MKSPARNFQYILLLLILFSQSTVWTDRSFAESADSLNRLRLDLDQIFSDRKFAGAHWGVQVYSLDRSESLYEKNPDRLLIPASNIKIITSVVALLRLGPDYVYRTLLQTDGAVLNGTLEGSLIVTGFGDPSIMVETPEEDPLETFRHWASVLKAAGIRKITGNILGNGGSFERPMLGQGWAWDDLPEGYAAPVSALQFNGNRLWLEITPRKNSGAAPSLKLKPLPDYWIIENLLITKKDLDKSSIEIERNASDDSIIVRGNISQGAGKKNRAVAVLDPVRYYLSALKHVLASEGIDVLTCNMRDYNDTDPGPLSLLHTHTSPPLSEIMKPLMKESLNLHAETLTRTLGMELNGTGSFSSGREIVEETLERMAIDKDRYSYADGSGLSRRNLASAEILVRILRSIYRHPHFPYFHDALAVAGQDGTLETRMKGSRAENNVYAKTGSLSHVSAISGYVKTMDGEMLAFSMLANNFLLPKSEADAAQDKALKKLARFKRQ